MNFGSTMRARTRTHETNRYKAPTRTKTGISRTRQTTAAAIATARRATGLCIVTGGGSLVESVCTGEHGVLWPVASKEIQKRDDREQTHHPSLPWASRKIKQLPTPSIPAFEQ